MQDYPTVPDHTLDHMERVVAVGYALTLRLGDIIRQQHTANRLAFIRLENCWACGADREPGDRGDCARCGAGADRL